MAFVCRVLCHVVLLVNHPSTILLLHRNSPVVWRLCLMWVSFIYCQSSRSCFLDAVVYDSCLGPTVFFYSHRFDNELLDCIANKEDPTTFTQIQRSVPIVNDNPCLELSLLDPDGRKTIIETLDAIQQVLSAWTSHLVSFIISVYFLLFWLRISSCLHIHPVFQCFVSFDKIDTHCFLSHPREHNTQVDDGGRQCYLLLSNESLHCNVETLFDTYVCVFLLLFFPGMFLRRDQHARFCSILQCVDHTTSIHLIVRISSTARKNRFFTLLALSRWPLICRGSRSVARRAVSTRSPWVSQMNNEQRR